jgi:hypothetical protein
VLSPRRISLALSAAALVALSSDVPLSRSRGPESSLDRLPALMLWSWERADGFEFLDPASAGIAFLAGTVTLRDSLVAAIPRLQPITIPAAVRRVAVVRRGRRRPRSRRGSTTGSASDAPGRSCGSRIAAFRRECSWTSTPPRASARSTPR